jgi:hypothetical protein
LDVALRRRGQTEVRGGPEAFGLNFRLGVERAGRVENRARHEFRPASGPTVSRAEPSNHAKLIALVPRHPVLARPAGNAQIALVAHVIAGLAMAIERTNPMLAADGVEHVGHAADPNDEIGPELAEADA